MQNDSLQLLVAAPVVEAIDTTAAGDTFNGGIAVAIAYEMDWNSAIQFACRAASISVTRLGHRLRALSKRDLKRSESTL